MTFIFPIFAITACHDAFPGQRSVRHPACIWTQRAMKIKELNIRYREYEDISGLSSGDRLLVEEAVKSTANSYAPYSGFHVGAALRLSNGEIVTGSNQENAAYPSGLCAERTAMFYASARYPDAVMEAIAIAASQNGELCSLPASPCGACRQVMAQYQRKSGQEMKIILAGKEKILVFDKVEDIMPFVFDNI